MIRSERDWLAWVRRRAVEQGWRTYHTHDSRRSEPGFPDVVLVRGPALVFAELKMPGRYADKHQRAWLQALAGCDKPTVALWRPTDMMQVRRVLQAHEQLELEA